MAHGKKTDQVRIGAAERRQQALELRKQGYSYRALGAQLGVSQEMARLDVQRSLQTLAELERASADVYRTMELARLDMAMLAIAPGVTKGSIDAVNAWVRISESRRRLLGLDAPQKIAPTSPDGSAPYETQQQIISLVMRVLAPYPDLRLAIAEQLSEDDGDILDPTEDGA